MATESLRGDLHIFQLSVGVRIPRIYLERNRCGGRHQLVENSQALAFQGGCKETHPGHVTARPVQACNKSEAKWIAAVCKHDWNACRGSLGRERTLDASSSDDNGHLLFHKFGSKHRQFFVSTFGPAMYNRNILILIETTFPNPLPKPAQP